MGMINERDRSSEEDKHGLITGGLSKSGRPKAVTTSTPCGTISDVSISIRYGIRKFARRNSYLRLQGILGHSLVKIFAEIRD